MFFLSIFFLIIFFFSHKVSETKQYRIVINDECMYVRVCVAFVLSKFQIHNAMFILVIYFDVVVVVDDAIVILLLPLLFVCVCVISLPHFDYFLKNYTVIEQLN